MEFPIMIHLILMRDGMEPIPVVGNNKIREETLTGVGEIKVKINSKINSKINNRNKETGSDRKQLIEIMPIE